MPDNLPVKKSAEHITVGRTCAVCDLGETCSKLGEMEDGSCFFMQPIDLSTESDDPVLVKMIGIFELRLKRFLMALEQESRSGQFNRELDKLGQSIIADGKRIMEARALGDKVEGKKDTSNPLTDMVDLSELGE